VLQGGRAGAVGCVLIVPSLKKHALMKIMSFSSVGVSRRFGQIRTSMDLSVLRCAADF